MYLAIYCTGLDCLTPRDSVTCYGAVSIPWLLFVGPALTCQAINTNGPFGETLLAKARESPKRVMVKHVIHCVRQNIPDQQKVIQTSRATTSPHDQEMARCEAGVQCRSVTKRNVGLANFEGGRSVDLDCRGLISGLQLCVWVNILYRTLCKPFCRCQRLTPFVRRRCYFWATDRNIQRSGSIFSPLRHVVIVLLVRMS